MDRRRIFQKSLIAGVFASGILPAVHAQPAIRWRLASSFPKPLDTIYGTAEVFANHVRAISGGKFEISVHAAGELMPALAVIDGVQQGSVEMCHTAPYYFYGKSPVFALGSTIPFGMNARQVTAWMTHGNGRRLMNDFYAGYGMRSFPGGNTGTQMGGWFRKEIKDVTDLKGLKMRLGGGLLGEVMSRMGVIPQSIPAGEIYQSLEKGTIDAAEWIGPYDDLKLGFNKVAPNYYYPGWWEGGPEVEFMINQKAFSELTSENKSLIQAAAAAASGDMLAKYDALNPTALKQLVAGKAKLLAFPKSVMETAFKNTQEICDDLNGKNAEWKKIYTDYRQFQKDQLLWARFADNRFDNFMQSVSL